MKVTRKLPWLLVLLVTLLLAAVAAGCGGDDDDGDDAGANGDTAATDTGGEDGGAAGEGMQIGLVTDIGGLNDRSFNQLANEGLERAKSELGASRWEERLRRLYRTASRRGVSQVWAICISPRYDCGRCAWSSFSTVSHRQTNMPLFQ